MHRAARTEGFALTLMLLTFLIIELIGVGVISITMSDLHGAVANRLAMDSVNVAEAGLNYGAAQLVSQASAAAPTDTSYRGEPREIPVTGPDGEARSRASIPAGHCRQTATIRPRSAAANEPSDTSRPWGSSPLRPGGRGGRSRRWSGGTTYDRAGCPSTACAAAMRSSWIRGPRSRPTSGATARYGWGASAGSGSGPRGAPEPGRPRPSPRQPSRTARGDHSGSVHLRRLAPQAR